MNIAVRLISAVQPVRNRRLYASKVKVDLVIHPDIERGLDDKSLRLKHVPGLFRKNVQTLPQRILNAVDIVSKDDYDMKTISKECEQLANKLVSRPTPNEQDDVRMRAQIEHLRIQAERKYDVSDLDEEKAAQVLATEEKNVFQRLKPTLFAWKPMDYNRSQCLQYLISRTPKEYGALHKIFCEIAVRDPSFVPRTLFDFGSGVGSGFWAAREVWNKPFSEVFNVDINENMNDLAIQLLCDGNKQKNVPVGIFFRQFLPASPEPSYDIVLSAYSLLELPSMKHRAEILLTLWAKTNEYLVIVEHGSNAGYQVVTEARDLILNLSKVQDADSEYDKSAHVFAPCPHDMPCPRFAYDFTPCNFEVQCALPFQGSIKTERERYSYVVIKKKPRASDDLQWPRCVRHTMNRTKHVICTVCTADGQLQQPIFTKTKHRGHVYNIVRRSTWGDLLPGKLVQNVVPNSGESFDSDMTESSTANDRNDACDMTTSSKENN